ncbi:phage portal protein [Tepidiforma flava]|uniref:Phage portal protein n=1 Tax=Tepidiforma flava TaxID=3004094 RepID=A0ABY7M9W2_9CHLR|nr:phage portal protein [Tepidiforma flava]WBL37328.1 phage portal protein [Tepidiforma flava]
MPYQQLPLPDPPLPALLRQLDFDRMARYRECLDFYQGRHWPGRPRRGERRLTFNYARAVVDKVTGYLLAGASVQVAGDETPAGLERARRAERALRRVEAANGVSQLDFETELDCAVLGDGAYRVAWDAAAGEVRITAPDVQGIFAWRDPADPNRLTAVAHRYRAGEEELIEYWTPGGFELWRGSTLEERLPNPYGFIPYVVFPNVREPKQAWGSSDIPPLMEANRELNRAFSQLSQVLELSGNPIAVLEGVTGSEDITVEPGAIWEVPEDARAYLLDLLQGGGVALHTAYIDLLYRVLHDLGESPRTAFGHNPQGLSGVALNTELDPIARKVERKRRIRTAVYERRAWMVLQLLARFEGLEVEGLRPVMQWGPVLPADRSRQVQDARQLVESGIISRRTAAASLGIDDPEAEAARVREEAG